jgi:hypothetical protein
MYTTVLGGESHNQRNDGWEFLRAPPIIGRYTMHTINQHERDVHCAKENLLMGFV